MVFSAESTIDDFHRLLDEIARVEVPGEVTRVMERFRDGRFEFPDRVHLTAAVWLLQANMIRALVDWARWLRAESGDWIDLHPSEEKSSWATEVLTEVADTLAAWDERQNDESASLS